MLKEFRAAAITAPAPMTLEGYAVVFDVPARINGGDNGYSEWIRRGALDTADMADVALFYNHDTTKIPLARTPNTMKLKIDNHGLKFSAQLPDTTEGQAVYEAVKRGDLRGCSFAFTVADGGDDWISGTRFINRIAKIYECSVVPYPAYSETSVEARSKGESTMKFENVADSFNYYKNLTVMDIERRAAEIDKEINSDGADIAALTVELEGMKQARANVEERAGMMNSAKATLKTMIGFDAESPAASDEEIVSTPEYRNAFYKFLQGKELGRQEQRAMKIAKSQLERRAGEFSTSTNSAAVIPTSTFDEIIRKARKTGGLMAEARAFSVPSKIAIPIGTPTSKAAWHVEGAAVDSEKVSLTTVTFDGNEIIKIFSISAKVQTMSIASFESYLIDELEACVVETLSDALINGTGSGQGTGILSAFDSSNTVSTTAISYEDVVDAASKLKRGYANGAKWAMNNRTLYTVFYSMVDANQRPLFISDPKIDGVGRILGFDVVIDDYLPDNTVIFGNFNYMGYNLPSGIVIETSRESSFKSGLIDYRALAVADCKPLVNEAFVKLSVG